jgi:hypothetical protein
MDRQEVTLPVGRSALKVVWSDVFPGRFGRQRVNMLSDSGESRPQASPYSAACLAVPTVRYLGNADRVIAVEFELVLCLPYFITKVRLCCFCHVMLLERIGRFSWNIICHFPFFSSFLPTFSFFFLHGVKLMMMSTFFSKNNVFICVKLKQHIPSKRL